MSKKYKPQFLIIPYAICEDKQLRARDIILHGVIRYFTKMGKRKCIASNESLKECCGYKHERSVQLGLARLQSKGWIDRIYKKTSRANRVEIIWFESPQNVDEPQQVIVPERTIDHHISNSDKEEDIPKGISCDNALSQVCSLDNLPFTSGEVGECFPATLASKPERWLTENDYKAII